MTRLGIISGLTILCIACSASEEPRQTTSPRKNVEAPRPFEVRLNVVAMRPDGPDSFPSVVFYGDSLARTLIVRNPNRTSQEVRGMSIGMARVPAELWPSGGPGMTPARTLPPDSTFRLRTVTSIDSPAYGRPGTRWAVIAHVDRVNYIAHIFTVQSRHAPRP
jgi:hypothetical protein